MLGQRGSVCLSRLGSGVGRVIAGLGQAARQGEGRQDQSARVGVIRVIRVIRVIGGESERGQGAGDEDKEEGQGFASEDGGEFACDAPGASPPVSTPRTCDSAAHACITAQYRTRSTNTHKSLGEGRAETCVARPPRAPRSLPTHRRHTFMCRK